MSEKAYDYRPQDGSSSHKIDARTRAKVRAFLNFSQWLDDELEKLENHWLPITRNSASNRRRLFEKTKPK